MNDSFSPLHEKDKVFLNRDWVGVSDDSLIFVTKLRRLCHNKKLFYHIEIIIQERRCRITRKGKIDETFRI